MLNDQHFDPRGIPASELAHLRSVILTHIEEAPELCGWVHHWLDTEQYWRRTGDPDKRPEQHAIAYPPAFQWSDVEVGRGLRVATTMSYLPLLEPWSDFIDRICITVSEEASLRLEGKKKS